MSEFKNKIVIVTGGGSGFGAGIVRGFASAGATVVAADINLEAAENVAAEFERVEAIKVDVSDWESVRMMIDQVAKKHGGIDVLINNAGIPHKTKSLLDLEPEEADMVWRVNVNSVFYGSKAAIPWLKKRNGVIINTASTGALRPRPNLTYYNATKSAVQTLTRGLALELAPDIRVCAVNPVVGETGFTKGAHGVDEIPEKMREQLMATIPMGRAATPEDIAEAMMFLASEKASMITGVLLDVDGGRTV